MKRILIVGGGPVNLSHLKSELNAGADLVIAADRGGSYLLELGFTPGILIGDFDSLTAQAFQQLKKAGTKIQSFPAAKDQTDLELAVELAIRRNPARIDILGGLGGRFDHTFGNVGLLVKALESNVEAHLLNKDHDITVINRKIILKRKPGWAVSLIPLSLTAVGVTTTGLAFKLENADLFFRSTRGIHNEYTEDTAIIELTRGILMVVCFRIC